MGGIVYNKKKVEEEFLERWKSKDWRDKTTKTTLIEGSRKGYIIVRIPTTLRYFEGLEEQENEGEEEEEAN